MVFVVITYVNVHFFQKLSYNSMRNSFDSTPQCDLVFHPTTSPGKSSFFVVMAFTQAPSSKTVMYASTAIKKVFIMNQNITVKKSWVVLLMSLTNYSQMYSLTFSCISQLYVLY